MGKSMQYYGREIMFDKWIGSVVRHGLTTVGGVLIAIGVGESETQTFITAAIPVVSGGLSIGLGIALSFAEKRARKLF